jgi:hypothetical protein
LNWHGCESFSEGSKYNGIISRCSIGFYSIRNTRFVHLFNVLRLTFGVRRRPTRCRNKSGSSYPLQIVRRPQRRRFILIPQFLFGLMVELLILAIRLARLLPKFVCAPNDVHFGWLFHLVHPPPNPPPAGSTGGPGVGASGERSSAEQITLALVRSRVRNLAFR